MTVLGSESILSLLTGVKSVRGNGRGVRDLHAPVRVPGATITKGNMTGRPPGRLLALVHYRWAAPVLAEIHRGGGSRFVTLANRLGMSRDSLRRTLAWLIETGWVMRNPGYGHPMRPEYVLTAAGRRVAPWCVRLMGVLRALRAENAALRKWSLPVAFVIRGGPCRFSELRARFPEVTPRALALTLKTLEKDGLVERVVVNGYPPRTSYRLAPRARRLGPLLEGFPG